VSNAGKEFSGNWALFITINPSLIDVNIHPAKAEIRFRYTGEVFDSIKKASIILSGNPSKLVFSSTKNGNDDVNVPGNQPRPGYIHNLSFSGRSQNLFTRTASSFDTELQPNISEPNSKSLSAFADSPFKKGGIQNEVVDGPTFNEGSKINEAYVLNATLSDTENYVAKGDNNKSSNYNDQESDLADLNDSESDVKFISQLSSGYLIFETSSSVIIMDPHAAHERIMYEAIMKKSIDGIMTQMLISPEPLQPTLAIQVQELEKELFSVGFSFKNENGLYLTGIPFNLGNISAPLSILRATLAVWSDNGKVCKLDEQLMARWAEIACKSSVKLSSVIHPSEARDLWKKLHTCKQPYSCPHGRPTILKIENSELSKHFGRSV
jgi:DNA mismatch repair protein MutL